MPTSPLPKARRCWDALLHLPYLLPLLLLLFLPHTAAAFLMPSPSSCIRSTSISSTMTRPSSPSWCVSLPGLRRQTCSTALAASSSSQSIPPDLVDALAERPWRTGLEPAEDVDMLEVPADCIEVSTGLAGGEGGYV